MPIWEAVLLGIIQGLTEFLPISSTAHLLLARAALGHEKPEDAFTTVIQLGTLVAVIAYFWPDIVKLTTGFIRDSLKFQIGASPEGRMAWLIILGTLPVVVVGLALKKWLKANFYNLPAIALVAIAFALLLAAAEWWAHRRTKKIGPARPEEDISWLDALWIGCWQCLALMPGGSRSGTTITGGLFAGLSRSAAARFSFLLSLPAVFAAGMKELYDERKELFRSGDDVATLLVGLVVSGVVGYLSIAWLLHFLKRYSTVVFIVYRIILGVTILALLWRGVIQDSTWVWLSRR